MWYIYGTVSLIAGIILLTGIYLADNADKADYLIIIITLSLICVFAGLDWLNLIPEV